MTGNAQTVTFGSLLQEMVNRDACAEYPNPSYRQFQGSTYNRASYSRIQPDQSFGGWHADSDGVYYIRTETNNLTGALEYVIVDTTMISSNVVNIPCGGGAITKIWSPYFYYGSLADHGGVNIRIYLNGSDTPVLDENLIQLVSNLEWDQSVYGTAPDGTNDFTVPYPLSAFTARAGDCYLPIPFSKSCKVTLSGPPFYDIVSYRLYTPGTVVEDFTKADYYSLTNQQLLTNATSNLAAPTNFSGGNLFQSSNSLIPGQGITLNLSAGPAAVRDFEVLVDTNQMATNPGALRSTVVIMVFDGEQTIWVPLGDFFSCADSLHPFWTWQRAVTTNGQMSCRWVMPYQSNATLTLTNLGTNSVTATLTARTDAWTWDSNSMHFHASWRTNGVAYGTPPSDWNFLDVNGRGVCVGDSWTIGNPQGGWWGEGDERIYASEWEYDTNYFPGIHGTGTEDYYGWAGGVNPTEADEFRTPFLANVKVGGLDGGTLGYNICTRQRALDAIPFSDRLVFDMESSFGTDIRNPWDVLGYSSVVFWYAVPGAVVNRPPVPAPVALPIFTMAELNAISQGIEYGAVSNLAPGSQWNLGEQDAGAVVGGTGASTTTDAIGNNNLTAFGSPIYSGNVPPGGSTFSVGFDGGSYYRSDNVSTLKGLDYQNFMLSLDVYPTSNPGYNAPMSMGLYGGRSSFFYISGGNWYYNMNGTADISLGAAAITNAWTHLEFQRVIGTNHWFINGNPAGPVGNTQAPGGPLAATVCIGGIASAAGSQFDGGGDWHGQVDNVVLQNLLPVIASGPSLVPNFGSVAQGGTFSFSVVATGEQPLTYLWRQNGIVVTNSSSNPGVVFSNAVPDQSGSYDLVISNGFGAVTSSVVAVTVTPVRIPPSITEPLMVSPILINVDQSFTLTASGVGGGLPLTYLWRFNGVVVSNTGSADSVTFNHAVTNQSGAYDLVITNAYGAVTSSAVAITVSALPTSPHGVKAWFRLGEADPGAIAGAFADVVTTDEVGTNNLYRLGYPTYNSDVWTNGGRLSMAFHSATGDWFVGTNLPVFKSLNLSNLTVSFDVKPTAAGSYNIAVGLGQYGAGCCIFYMAGGMWHFNITGIGDEIVGGTAVLNQWQHISFVRTNGMNSLFVNGVQVGATGNTQFPALAQDVSIGAAFRNSGDPDGLFDGLIDNVIITDPTVSLSLVRPVLKIEPVNQMFQISVAGTPGYLSTLWRTPQLSPAAWSQIADGVTSLGGHALLIDPSPLAAAAFYSVTVR